MEKRWARNTRHTTREVVVSLTWEAEHGAAYKLFVEGSRIGESTGPSAAGTHTGIGHCFPVGPGQHWELTREGGTVNASSLLN